MQLKDFDFNLPSELIAQVPLPRGESRLLCCNKDMEISSTHFNQVCELLSPGDVIVLNNTKVIPAAIVGEINGKSISINLISRVYSEGNERWEVLSKPRKRLELGATIKFPNNMTAKVIEKFNHHDLDVLEFNASADVFYNALDEIGSMPLPPYIKREADELDEHSYQTVFADVKGSVAAPTAGLHFTDTILKKLSEKGIKIAYVTLHVGGGTFLPVRTDDISEHKMHSEFYTISKENCDIINSARVSGGRVVAVGTTVTRTLETIANDNGDLSQSSGYTNIFIKGDYKFKIVDVLITNFHLPKSTLFMLVCSFLGGINNGKALYEYAIENNFRFFSYGDACFLVRQ